MYLSQSGTSYTVYLQNDYYAQRTLSDREALKTDNGASLSFDKGLDDYLNKIIDSIPELKASQESGIGVGFIILPESAPSDLKDAVSVATNKMVQNQTEPDILKGVLGIVKDNFSLEYENRSGYTSIKNDTHSFDMSSLNSLLNNFKDTYGSNKPLSDALGKFADYLNEIWSVTNKQAGNTNIGSIFSANGQSLPDTKKGQFLNTAV